MRKLLVAAVLAIAVALAGGIVLALVRSGGIVLAADPSQNAWPLSGAPISTVSVSTTSASTGTLSGATCYRVACSVTVFWRVGTLPLTALTSDNQFFGPATELICLRSGYNGIAFVTAAGTGTCTVNSYAPSP